MCALTETIRAYLGAVSTCWWMQTESARGEVIPEYHSEGSACLAGEMHRLPGQECGDYLRPIYECPTTVLTIPSAMIVIATMY